MPVVALVDAVVDESAPVLSPGVEVDSPSSTPIVVDSPAVPGSPLASELATDVLASVVLDDDAHGSSGTGSGSPVLGSGVNEQSV